MAEHYEGEDETRRLAEGSSRAETPGPQQAPYGAPRPRAEERFRRWSRSAPARFVAVGLLAGLVGGLVGGGIVAAVAGGGDDHVRTVRIQRGAPPWFGPRQFRHPRGEPFFSRNSGQPRPTPTS